jgi:hypothetical protein
MEAQLSVVLQTALDVVQAGAVVAAAWVGAKTLNAWRREMIGRKKADLAEQTLAAFYEARDIITAARHPGSFDYEGKSRQPMEGETESEASYRNSVYVPAERLLGQNEFFARLEASKYRFMALFGKEHTKPFDTIKKVRNRVLSSSGMLIRTHSELAYEREELRRNREKWERNIGMGLTEEDPLADKVEAAIAEIERVCVAALTGTEQHGSGATLGPLQAVGFASCAKDNQGHK